jgi:hypothetical protein
MRKYLATFVGVAATFIGLLSVHAQSAFSNALIALNPVAYWPLNETTAPPSPALAATNLGSLSTAYNAAYGGAVAFGVPGAIAGTTDTAAGFDGLSADVRTAYGSGISNAPSFTIEAWLLSHNINATQCPLCNMDAASPRSGWLIYMDISNPGEYTFRAYAQNGTTPALALNIGAADSVAQDQWNHLVVVVSNGVTVTNVYGYLNGVLVAGPTELPAYVPDDGLNSGTFTIGGRSDGGYFFDGNIDEVAYYTTALDANTIAAHYSAGTNTSPSTPYNTLVMDSTPALYYRLDQPAAPVAHNYGSLGSAANGFYQTGTAPGVAGPSFGPFGNGFGSSDFATQFSPSGTQSGNSGPAVTCAQSNPNVLNLTNSITVAAWVKVPTVPTGTNGWFEGVLGRGDAAFRFAVDTSSMPHFADGGNADIVGPNALNDGNWHYWVGTYDLVSSNANLYIDSVLAGTATWSQVSGTPDNEFIIGGAPDYNGRNFVGEVAQVAIFTNALSISQIQSVFNATAPSPFEFAVLGLSPLAYWPLTETIQPPAPATFVATNLGTVGAALNAGFFGDVVFGVPGALASSTDTADEFNGSTTGLTNAYTADLANPPPFTIETWVLSHNINATQCALCNMDAASPRSGWLIYMDISNPGEYTFRAYAQNGTTPALALNIGSANSVAQDQWNHLVVVVSNAVTVTNVYGYLNGVLVAGPTPLPAYVPNDGQNDGTFSIGGRSDSGYRFDGDLDEVAYYTNALDANAVLTHYQAGTNPNPVTAYSQLVLQQKPIIYLRLDEAPAGSPYPIALPVAANYGSTGAASTGYYETGTMPGVPGPFGPNSLACAFDPTNSGPADTSGPGVLCDPYNLTALDVTGSLTLSAWVEVPTATNAAFETVVGRSDSSYRFSVDTSQFPHFAYGGNVDITASITINDGKWHLWTGVYNAVNGNADLYIDGIVEGSAVWSEANISPIEKNVFIGGAPDYGVDKVSGQVTRGFTGSVSHVAIFTNALTQAQIQAAYATIGVPPSPPIIVQQPVASVVLFAGATLDASVTVTGPGPFSYQWYADTSNQVANATSAALALPNVQATNTGSYSCIISNRYGTATSAVLSLSVVTPLAHTYEAAVLAYQPVAFYPLNETSGTTAYEYVAGNNGTYQTNSLIGQPGVANPPFEGFPATDYSVDISGTETNAWVSAPFGTLEGSGGVTMPNLTFTCWIYPVGDQNTSAGLIVDRSGVNGGFDISPSGGATDGMLGYVWNNNASDTYDFVSNLTPPQNQWSLVALAISPEQAVFYLYNTNGRAASTNAIPQYEGLLGGQWRIGNDAAGDPARSFNGMIDAVAVFPSALSSVQMNALFDTGTFGTTNVRPVVIVPSAPVTVDQGGNGSIVSTVVDGPAPYYYQWNYVASGVTNTLTGATNATLALTDIQSAWSSYQYYVVVSNNYGATTSSFVTLSILSGAPTLVADVSPLLTVVPAGLPVTFFVTATGTEPFYYVWLLNSVAIAGATNSSYTFDALAGSNNYSVTISNSVTSISSSTAVVLGVTNAPPIVGFNGNGTNWTLNQGPGWPGAPTNPSIVNDLLTLTDATNGEACSAFYNTPQYIGSFIASYIYQVQPASSVADGVTFCMQDSTNAAYGLGPTAVGNGGGDLGYNGITPSVAFEMNVYVSANGGVGILLGTNGLTADSTPQLTPYGPTAPVNIGSFDPIYIQLYYSESVMRVYLSDGKLTYTTNYTCNVPATLGSDSAYIGFTAGDGAVNSYQTVSNFLFSYTTPAILSVARKSAGTVVVSWPVSVSTLFVLQEATVLNGTWSNVTQTPQVVNGENEVTLTPGTSTAYYRLSLQ